MPHTATIHRTLLYLFYWSGVVFSFGATTLSFAFLSRLGLPASVPGGPLLMLLLSPMPVIGIWVATSTILSDQPPVSPRQRARISTSAFLAGTIVMLSVLLPLGLLVHSASAATITSVARVAVFYALSGIVPIAVADGLVRWADRNDWLLAETARQFCTECGYDLQGQLRRCPECGQDRPED
ncbi:MAG: hypothetical protein AB8G96_10885 [Phycisphaerales bacterium]